MRQVAFNVVREDENRALIALGGFEDHHLVVGLEWKFGIRYRGNGGEHAVAGHEFFEAVAVDHERIELANAEGDGSSKGFLGESHGWLMAKESGA